MAASAGGTPLRRLPPLPCVGDILRMYGIKAKKNLSQNFMLDPTVLRKFVKTAGDLKGKRVIEVGPGPGGITRAAFQAGAAEVHVIELDTRFIPSLKLLQESVGPDRLHINIGNCLHFNVQKMFPPEASKDWDSHESPDIVILGNLPFNVATPYLMRLLRDMGHRAGPFSFGRVSSVLTFQHEVALRMVAPPGDPERCRLSVSVQNWADVEYAYNLPGGAFMPPPDVDVGVVRLTPLQQPYIRDMDFDSVTHVVTALFSGGKRKSIKNSIMSSSGGPCGLFPKSLLTRDHGLFHRLIDLASVSPDKRAIDLTMSEVRDLCLAYRTISDELINLPGSDNRRRFDDLRKTWETRAWHGTDRDVQNPSKFDILF